MQNRVRLVIYNIATTQKVYDLQHTAAITKNRHKSFTVQPASQDMHKQSLQVQTCIMKWQIISQNHHCLNSAAILQDLNWLLARGLLSQQMSTIAFLTVIWRLQSHDEYNNTKDCDCWNEQWMLTHTYHNYSYSIYAIPLHSVAV